MVVPLKNFIVLILISIMALTACTNHKSEGLPAVTSATPNTVDLEKIKTDAYEKAKADLEEKAQVEAKAKAAAAAEAEEKKAAQDKAIEAKAAVEKTAADEKAKADEVAEEKKKADFEKQKTEILQQNPKVSDFGRVGDLIVMVNKQIDSTPMVGTNQVFQTAKGIYRFLYVSVLNNGKKPQTIDSNMFKLVSNDGITYEADPTAASYANVENKFFLEKVNPGTEARGYIVFDMPPEVKFSELKLRVATSNAEHVDLNFVKP